MQKAGFFDTFLFLFGVWLLSLLWSRYYFSSLPFCLAVSCLFVCVVYFLSQRLLRGKRERAKLTAASKKTTAALQTYLYTHEFSPAPLLLAKGWQPKEDRLFQKDGHVFAVFCKFTVAPLSPDDLLPMLKQTPEDVLVFCTSANAACTQIAAALHRKITVCDVATLASLLRERDLLPSLPSAPPRRNRLLTVAFCKERANAYLLSAVFLLLSSVFSFFPLYPLITATLLVLLALYAKWNKRYNVSSAVL